MKWLFVFLCLFSQSFAASYQEIEDLSHLPLLNPEFSERKTAKIQLQNGLKLFLISDPNTDQSGASVAVEAGSWDDPEEYPGMAHFCEHMLFMGTQKYPNENEFFSEVTNFGGIANAHTGPHRTVYIFSSQTPGFLSLLDRFAHFFIDPLFNPANVAREMHAVDHEFGKICENDAWRGHMVWKETGNQKHPNHLFCCGNSETLANIPQSALKKWHKQHYGANQMHVVLCSSLPLETLKEKAVELFSPISTSQNTSVDPALPLTSSEQRGHITYIQPIQHRQQLTLSWELPAVNDPNHSAKLIAYALNRGQKHSLYEKLKKEGLIDTLFVEIDTNSGKKHPFFQISFELTEKGISQIEKTALYAFQALANLRATGIPFYLFEEKNEIAKIHYQHQNRQDLFSTISNLGETLPDEPLATYPREQLLGKEYRPEDIASILSQLTPYECAVTLLAPAEKMKVELTKKERWMGVEYTIQPIPQKWISSWSNAKPHPEISLAEPNPFLPTQFQIFSEKDFGSVPISMTNSEFGVAYYARCPEYQTAEVDIHLHILSPVLQPTAESQVLASIYLDHLTDLLNPILKVAASAHLNASFELDRSRIYLNLFGFSEKAPLLLQEILRQMPLDPPTPEQFAIYYDRHQKAYANAEKELAYKQGKELLDSLLSQNRITSQEKLFALSGISYEDFLDFHKNLFETSFFEALFAGNLPLKEAESLWLDILHVLGKTPYPKAEHPETRIVRLPADGPFAVHQTTQTLGNSTLLAIEQGPFSFERRAAQEILSNALGEAFFNELRTKQKTGYIAATNGVHLEGRLFQIFLVQSKSHQPEDLLYRFELFLEEYLESFPISLDRFELLKASALHDLKTHVRNVHDKSDLWDLLAFERGADFAYLDKRVDAINALSYEAFCRYAKEFFARSNRKRLAILVEGKLPAPFAFESLTSTELQEIASYSPASEEPSEETVLLSP